MRRTSLIMAATAMVALAGCGGGVSADADVAEAATTEEASLESIEYVKDIGLLEDGFGDELNARLAEFHGQTGHELHIAVILTTDDQDIEEKAAEMIGERGVSENGALILIAAADENIGIVPAAGAADALDSEFTTATETEMARQFDAGEVTGGFNGAVDAIIERLSS